MAYSVAEVAYPQLTVASERILLSSIAHTTFPMVPVSSGYLTSTGSILFDSVHLYCHQRLLSPPPNPNSPEQLRRSFKENLSFTPSEAQVSVCIPMDMFRQCLLIHIVRSTTNEQDVMQGIKINVKG